MEQIVDAAIRTFVRYGARLVGCASLAERLDAYFAEILAPHEQRAASI